jgi:hypothetical protein
MSFSNEKRTFYDWLDEVPCTSNGILVRTPAGETRNVPRGVFAQEFRSRVAPAERFPRREQARNRTAIFTHMLEKEERDVDRP